MPRAKTLKIDGKAYGSIREAARDLGVSHVALLKAINKGRVDDLVEGARERQDV